MPSIRRWNVVLLAMATALMLALLPLIVHADDRDSTNNEPMAATVQASEVSSTPQTTTAGGYAVHPKVELQELQNFRPHDMRGLNVFEAPKSDTEKYDGKKLVWGFGFAQQFQGLRHSNPTAQPKMVVVSGAPVNSNQLVAIGYGFNNATANLYLDAQIARGIRVSLTSYLSSRHHSESWVKDGFLLIDASPIDQPLLNNIMEVVTLRVGHFEINYGDAHFRRTDNGNAFFNPFVGNLLMDAFTTEIGAEAYLRKGSFLGMAGITGGEVKGQVSRPADRSPTYLAKVGVDRMFTPDIRMRLTSSLYRNARSVSNTLYSGSRSGSRYYSVLENTQSTESAQAWSGDVQPGFKNQITAVVINPFVKVHGFEFFGNVEQAKGRAATESVGRVWTQLAGEGLYRFDDNRYYVGTRFNTVRGVLPGINGDVSVERLQTGGGWFVTTNVLAKAEYVRENYLHFPASDIRSSGRFDGFVIEGVVTF